MLYRVIELPRQVSRLVDPYQYVRLEVVKPDGVVETIEGKTIRTKVDDILRKLAQPNDFYQEEYLGGFPPSPIQDLATVLQNWDEGSCHNCDKL